MKRASCDGEGELTEEGEGSGEEEDHKVKQVDSNRV